MCQRMTRIEIEAANIQADIQAISIPLLKLLKYLDGLVLQEQ